MDGGNLGNDIRQNRLQLPQSGGLSFIAKVDILGVGEP
jgi:hypothetical protein